MTSLKDFLTNNIRSLIVIVSFIVTMYVQQHDSDSRADLKMQSSGTENCRSV